MAEGGIDLRRTQALHRRACARRHGSRNRWIDWYILRDGAYQQLRRDEDQVYRSELFPGLWLDVPAIDRGDTKAVLTTLRRGLDSSEHAELVARRG